MTLEEAYLALYVKAGTVSALTHSFFFFQTYDRHLKHLT